MKHAKEIVVAVVAAAAVDIVVVTVVDIAVVGIVLVAVKLEVLVAFAVPAAVEQQRFVVALMVVVEPTELAVVVNCAAEVVAQQFVSVAAVAAKVFDSVATAFVLDPGFEYPCLIASVVVAVVAIAFVEVIIVVAANFQWLY